MPPHPRKKTNSEKPSASATPAANVTDDIQITQEHAVLAIGLDTLVLDQVAAVCIELHASLTHFNTPN